MVGSHQGGATVEKTAWVYQAQEARTDDGMGGPAGTYDWYRLARQEKWLFYTARVDGDLRNGYGHSLEEMEHAEASQKGKEGSSDNPKGIADQSSSPPTPSKMEAGGRTMEQGSRIIAGNRR